MFIGIYKKLGHALFGLLIVVSCGTGGCRKKDPEAAYPSRPVKLIVPFSAGGGTDTFARIIKKAIDDNQLLPQPLVIINQGGAGATIGSRRVKNAEPDGYTMLVLHEAILTARYSGVVDYGPESFEPIAGTGEVGMVIAVAHDSPYDSLTELMEDVAARPDQVSFAANVGAMTHFAALQLEKAYADRQAGSDLHSRQRPASRSEPADSEPPDSESADPDLHPPAPTFRIAQSGGGADRYADLLGGHVDVTGFSIEEFVRFRREGIRGLAFLGETRHPAAPDLPAAREQGLDVAMSNIFYWWFPQGTPPKQIDVMSRALVSAMQTDYVRQKMEEIHCEPLVLVGPDLRKRLAERARQMARVAPREVVQPPNLVVLLGIAIVALVSILVVQEIRFRATRSVQLTNAKRESRYGFRQLGEPAPHRMLALISMLLTVLYVALMAGGLSGFRLATAGYVLIMGLALGRPHWKTAAGTIVLMLALSLGLHALLTTVFTVDLP